jgi:hypothetical protein
MTAELAGRAAPDVEELVVAWLAPVVRSAVERRPGDPLPFCVVQRVAGGDDPDRGHDEPIVQLDYLAEGVEAASAGANLVHRRMTYWARTLAAVAMHDGCLVNPDYLDTLFSAERMPYAHDRIVRYVARYQVGLSYVAA